MEHIAYLVGRCQLYHKTNGKELPERRHISESNAAEVDVGC